MARFRKRPIVVDAWQVVVSSPTPDWIIAAMADGRLMPGGKDGTWGRHGFLIRTLEGEMWANLRDWIIRGISGELYPCKPDIFAATYEPEDTNV